MSQLPRDGIAASGASNPRPFGYESYALTNCAITAYGMFQQRATQRLDVASVTRVEQANQPIRSPPLLPLSRSLSYALTHTHTRTHARTHARKHTYLYALYA